MSVGGAVGSRARAKSTESLHRVEVSPSHGLVRTGSFGRTGLTPRPQVIPSTTAPNRPLLRVPWSAETLGTRSSRSTPRGQAGGLARDLEQAALQSQVGASVGSLGASSKGLGHLSRDPSRPESLIPTSLPTPTASSAGESTARSRLRSRSQDAVVMESIRPPPRASPIPLTEPLTAAERTPRSCISGASSVSIARSGLQSTAGTLNDLGIHVPIGTHAIVKGVQLLPESSPKALKSISGSTPRRERGSYASQALASRTTSTPRRSLRA